MKATTKTNRNAIAIDFAQFIGDADDVFEPASCVDAGALVSLEYVSPHWAEPKAPAVKNSRTVNPCKRVWVIADSMKGSRRCDVIRACEAEGIATNTAKTQYQQWYSLNK